MTYPHNDGMSRLLPWWCVLLLACTDGGVGGPGGPADDDTASPDDDTTSDDDDSGLLEHVPAGWSPPEYDSAVLPDGVPVVSIEIDPEAMARLDADPFAAADEQGVFIDSDGVAHEVDLNYRGAYQLLNVMTYYGLRNWKVKFAADDLYEGRREWNLNYEPHFKQKLAFDLFRFAGVAVPGAQHVVLQLNGAYQGMYLRYEDPDDKRWLLEQFGDDEGDLYKGAFDIPDQPQCFADLTWLGPSDEDYVCHYSKKTNDEVAPDDFGVLRDFITDLNEVPDEEFLEWLETRFDVERLRSYLVVSNFIANWDSYPQRPKNYWLYEDLHAERMVYVPWDLDNTFNPYTDPSYNQMGTTASVLFDLLSSDYDPPHEDEGYERPLVRRLMAIEDQQLAYLDRYRELCQDILSRAYLDDRLTALTAIVVPEISTTDRQRLESHESSTREFILQRSLAVEAELVQLP